MKILYSALDRNIFDPQKKEASFEYMGFYLTLRQMPGIELLYLPQDELSYGPGAPQTDIFDQKLQAMIAKEKPDLFLFVPHPVMKKETVKHISETTVTLAFVFDDDIGFYDSSRFWGKTVDWMVNFYPRVTNAYQRRGMNVITTNWACNTDFFKPLPGVSKDIDVSFIGAAKPERKELIETLRRTGIRIEVWGKGWPNGVVEQARLAEVINRSKINLNIGHAPSLWGIKPLARLFFKRSKRFGVAPDFWHCYSNAVSLINSRLYPQARCRPFELLGCRTLLITNRNGVFVGQPYVENKEIVYYRDAQDLIEKIKYYLAHNEEREQIAEAGYQRTIGEHTFRKRFEDIFACIFSGDPKRKLHTRTLRLPDLPYID